MFRRNYAGRRVLRGRETGGREIQPEIQGFAPSSGETASHLAADMLRVRKELPGPQQGLPATLVEGSGKPFFLPRLSVLAAGGAGGTAGSPACGLWSGCSRLCPAFWCRDGVRNAPGGEPRGTALAREGGFY